MYDIVGGGKRHLPAVMLFGALLALVFCVPSYSSDVPELAVHLGDEIRPRGEVFYLGEYARIEGNREAAAAASMVEMRARDKITAADVINAISGRVGGVKLRLYMPPEVTVLPEDALERRIRTEMGWQWRVYATTDIPVSYDLEFHREVRPGVSGSSLVAEKNGRKKYVRVWLKWFQPVIMLKVNVKKDDIVRADNVYTALGLMESYRPLAWSVDQVVGKSVTSNVNPHVPMGLDSVASAVVVRAGSHVVIMASVNGAVVGVAGTALEHGAVGDLVRVRNNHTRKILGGVVTGPGVVQIVQQEVESGDKKF